MSVASSSSSWFLFSRSASGGNSLSKQQDGCLLWLWTAIGVGVVGFKLCSDALEFYRFCAAWNRMWRRSRIDGDTKDKSKERLERRKLEIERALATLTFGELQKELFGGNNNNENDAKTKTPLQPTVCKVAVPNSSFKATATESMTLETTCPVCLDDFSEDAKIMCAKNFRHPRAHCQHIFHEECLKAWLLHHASCPMCRHKMVSNPDPKLWPAYR